MNFERLTTYLDNLEAQYGIPASDIKITKEHQTIYRHRTGYADYEKRIPLNSQNLFRLFSATKLFTMTAVLQLVEKGMLGLYDEVRTYLPEFDRLVVADNFIMQFPTKWPTRSEKCHLAHETIRIIDLMTMTAGLSYDIAASELMEIKEKSKNRATTREVVAAMAKMPLVYEPRTRWVYSLGHDVLAAVVEVVSGLKFSEYLKEFIFNPLGIQEMYFQLDKEQERRLCALYMGVFDGTAIAPDDGSQSDGYKITEKLVMAMDWEFEPLDKLRRTRHLQGNSAGTERQEPTA